MTQSTAKVLNTRLKEVCLFSPAKLNLGLRIVGRREDGYHLLESVFWPLAFGDTLTLSEGALGIALSAGWGPGAPKPSDLPKNSDNLVVRAARAAGTKNMQMRLEKQIPLGAGLGGGSSNAGTFLKYIVDKNGMALNAAEQAAVALGADVAYFLSPEVCWVQGIGEKRAEIPIAEKRYRRHGVRTRVSSGSDLHSRNLQTL